MMKAGFVLVALGATMLAACGSGSSNGVAGGAQAAVSGTAATGKAIAQGQAVQAACAENAGFAAPVVVGTNGAFAGEVGAETLPCALAVATTSDSVGTLHSKAFAAGNVNVTPLTDLALAIARGQGFANPTQAQLEAAVQTLKAALVAAGFDGSILNGVDVFTTPFTPDGTGVDGLLDDLMAAFRNPSTGKGYGATIADFISGDVNPPILPHKLATGGGDSGSGNGGTDNGSGTGGNGDVGGGSNPQGTCTAAGLEGDNPLLSAASPLTDALCPNASKAAGFDPQTCFMEAANPGTFTSFDPSSVPGLGNLFSGFSSCDPGSDPMSCLTALTGTLQDIPGLMSQLPAQFADAFPGLGGGNDVCDAGSGLPFDPTQLMDQLQNLGGLADAAQQVPGLGSLFGALAGGGAAGGLPLDPSQLAAIGQQLQSGDFSGLTAQAQAVLNQIPMLGPIVGQLLGVIADTAQTCQQNPGPDCLSGVSGQLANFADVLQQIPGLGDAIAALTSGGVPGLPAGDGGSPGLPGGGSGGIPGLDQLQSALNSVPGLGPALNQGLGMLTNAIPAGGNGIPDPSQIANLFTDGAQQLQNIPGLGDLVGALASAASGGNPLENLPGLSGGTGGSAPGLDQLEQIPGVSQLIGAFSAGGTPSLEQLEQIPVLGDLIKAAQGAGGGGSMPGADPLQSIPGLAQLLQLLQGLPTLPAAGG